MTAEKSVAVTASKLCRLLCVALAAFACSSDEVTSHSNTVEYTQIDFDAAWSSSGKMIAYSHNDLDFDLSGIYTMDSSGSNKLQRVSGNASNPDWSPLDTAIIYEQGGAILILNLATGSNRLITTGTGAGKPSWNNVNGKIAFTAGDFLYVTEADGSNLVVVNPHSSWSDWSPDGRYLYYFQPAYLSGGVRGGDALIKFDPQDLSNTLISNITSGSYLDNSHLSVSDSLIFYSSTFGDGSSHVYVYDLSADTSAKYISFLSYSPSVEPVSGKLLYTNRTRSDGRLWVKDADGNSRKLEY